MNYIGIDSHKKYSYCSAIDESGEIIHEARIEGNDAGEFAAFVATAGGPCRAVLETGCFWAKVHDIFEEIDGVEEVVLAHAYKTRIIAEAQIKTDKLDARKLAQLLRGNFIARAHIPQKQTRLRKELLRQRAFWVRDRTRVRNRIHRVLGQQRELQMPQISSVWTKKGLAILRKLELPCPFDTLLSQDLDTLALLDSQVKELEKATEQAMTHEAMLLRTIPGFGLILSSMVADEIDGVERFRSAPKLVGYCGLCPSVHSSGGKTHHGRMLRHCNKWLKWAFIEAAWVAVGCDSYFGGIYRRHRARGKGANKSITSVARRMCSIAFAILHEQRAYQKHPNMIMKDVPGRSAC
jgi:transposase